MATDGSSMSDQRFLVIGCGSIGKRHLGNLQQIGIKDIIAFDVREDRRQEVQGRFGVQAFPDLSCALSQGCLVALICSPPSLHLEHALMAAQANCHLFIEKPITDRLDGLDRLLNELELRNLVTLVGCNYRFHPGMQKVRALLQEQAIGRPVSLRARFGQYLPDWHPWEDYRQGYSARRVLGGGVVLDRIHEFDYATWLLGKVDQVYAMSGHLSHLDIDTEDVAEVLLRFCCGAVGSIHLDYVRRTYDCSLEVVGDRGTIQWSYQDHTVRWYLAGEGKWQSLQWPGYDDNEMYLVEMRHFLRVLEGQEPAELDAAAAKQVLEVALAAKRSAESGEKVSHGR